ncbi:MAG: hypothetical protein JNJ43_01575 [Anaerolineales bacterium]|nr:hypothetical protein [Anaerolineales bacterium]
MTDQMTLGKVRMLADLNLLKLTPEHIKQIDEMLAEIGSYGQVHIIVENGHLRYINKVESRKFRNREDED